MRRFFENIFSRSGRRRGNESGGSSMQDGSSPDTESSASPIVIQHAGTVIEQANNATVDADDATVIAQEAEVHAGHAQIVAEKVVLHKGQPKSEEEIRRLEENFKEEIRKWTSTQTTFGVTDNFKKRNLSEPSDEFTPRLRITDFYDGSMVQTHSNRRQRRRSSKSERVYDKIWKQQQQQQHSVSTGDDIAFEQAEFTGLSEVFSRYFMQRKLAFVGQAESGKSTLMKRIARDLESGQLKKYNKKGEGQETNFVFVINVRDIPALSRVKPKDLLFGKILPRLDDDTVSHGYKWLVTNQENAVLVFDGLDQAGWTFPDKANKMKHSDKASTGNIMYNILSGTLFPDVRIIFSSREHTVARLYGELRPNIVAALAGLSMEDREKLFIQLAGKDGKKLWDAMCVHSPGLVPLSSIPLFLVFIVIVYKCDPENPPDTLTGIIVNILQIFIRSDHVHERKRIVEIVKKLKQLSFVGTREHKVVFSVQDLEELGLEAECVRDLVILVPGENIFSQFLMEGDYELYFCHQSVQELLAALYIVEMDLEEFQECVQNYLHGSDHWSVVRQFVCGILLNRRTFDDARKDLMQDNQTEAKAHFLKQSLAKRLGHSKSTSVELKLFACLYETNDTEFIQAVVQNIDTTGQVLTPSSMYALTSVMRRCSNITSLNLTRCSLNDENLKLLHFGLQSVQLKIAQLNISQNTGLGIQGIAAFGRLLSEKCDRVAMRSCGFGDEEMKCFRQSIGDSQIKSLDVSGNDKMKYDSFSVIGNLIHENGVEELEVAECNLDDTGMQILQQNSFCAKVAYINVSRNRKMHSIGFAALGKFVRQCGTKKVTMQACDIRENDMKSFQRSCTGAKINTLDVSGNSNMRSAGLTAVGEIIRDCEVTSIDLSCCDISTDALWNLDKACKGAKIEHINLSFNELEMLPLTHLTNVKW